jgi:hypothetical protein
MRNPAGQRSGTRAFVAPQGGGARIVVETSYFPLNWFLGFTGPTITLNGQPMNVNWGQRIIDLPPGQYHVQVHTRYLGRFGPAEAVVPVGLGQQAPVYYRAPAALLVNGAIGPVPQSTPGIPVLLAFIAVPVVIFVLTLIILSASAPSPTV